MITEIDPAEVPDALRTGTLDVALVQEYDYVPAPRDPALEARLLLTEPVYLAARSSASLSDLTDVSWIAGTVGTLCHTMTLRTCEAAGFTPRIRHLTDDFSTVLALVAAGQGVAFVPALGAERPPASVVLTELPTRRRTFLACRRGAAEHPAVVAARTALTSAAHGLAGVTIAG